MRSEWGINRPAQGRLQDARMRALAGMVPLLGGLHGGRIMERRGRRHTLPARYRTLHEHPMGA
jgi:hypothetical protein